MAELVLLTLAEATERQRQDIDNFIMHPDTNGEFINTIKYLDYHPKDRFRDDSVFVVDGSSGAVRAVMMAASIPGEPDTIISHPGTTFAGPIVNRRSMINVIEESISMMTAYYESKYSKVVLKTLPDCYALQPFGTVEYTLMLEGYESGIGALASMVNVEKYNGESDVIAGYDTTRRNELRRSQKDGLFTVEAGTEITEEAWTMMNETLKERFDSHTVHSLAEIRDLQQRFPEFITPYYVRTADGTQAAFALMYRFKHVFHTQYLDINYEYASQYPNRLLIHKLLVEASDGDYSFFSMGGCTENGGRTVNEGLYIYKARYGGGDVILPKFVKKV